MHVSFSFLCVERGFGFLLSLSCFCFDGGFVVFFCSVMARSPDKIKSIDGSKETLKLSVRISDLWFIGTPNKFEQAEMVFVDSDVCFNFVFFLVALLLITHCSVHCVVSLMQSRVIRSTLFVNKTN